METPIVREHAEGDAAQRTDPRESRSLRGWDQRGVGLAAHERVRAHPEQALFEQAPRHACLARLRRQRFLNGAPRSRHDQRAANDDANVRARRAPGHDRAQRGLVLDHPRAEQPVLRAGDHEVVAEQRPEVGAGREPERRVDPLPRLRHDDVRPDEAVEQAARRRALAVLRVGCERDDVRRLDRDVGQRLRERIGLRRRFVLAPAAAGERNGER